jgi:hypothetical protein
MCIIRTLLTTKLGEFDMDWQTQLISLYLFVCKHYHAKLHTYCGRFSNHADLRFSDEEVISIYLFGIIDGRSSVKEIFKYANRHLRSWFPELTRSYVVYPRPTAS